MTADLTEAQNYRRELEDALATLREAGDLGQYANSPPISQNSAKLESVANAALFVANHLWAVANRDTLGESPLYAFREPEPTLASRIHEEAAQALEDLPLTMASPPGPIVAGLTPMAPVNSRDYMKDLQAMAVANRQAEENIGWAIKKGLQAPHEYNPDFGRQSLGGVGPQEGSTVQEMDKRFSDAIKKGSGL